MHSPSPCWNCKGYRVTFGMVDAIRRFQHYPGGLLVGYVKLFGVDYERA
jgi:hypothetical protein